MGKALRLFLSAALLAMACNTGAATLIQPRIINGHESASDAWPFMTALMNKVLGISIDGSSFNATYLIGSPATLFSGELVDCGLASNPCGGVDGRICLISRGENTFASKVKNCEAGGGVGAIIFNTADEEGNFLGTLQRVVTLIPAVSVSHADGLQLLGKLGHTASFGYSSQIVPTQSFCGGTYIGGRWVVTAAHCVADVPAAAIMVNVGGHDLEKDQSNVISVAQVLPHSDYDARTINNDIALLKLEREPQNVQPIAVATPAILDYLVSINAPATMLGRGQQDPVGVGEEAPSTPVETVLFEVSAPLVSNEVCSRAIDNVLEPDNRRSSGAVTEAMVCAGRPEGNVGTCFGDSGGPMLIRYENQEYLAGITSWGIGCGQPNLYDVFTRVPLFKSDIEAAITEKTKSLGSSSNEPFGDKTGGENDSSGGGGGRFGSLELFLLLLFGMVLSPAQKISARRTLPGKSDDQ